MKNIISIPFAFQRGMVATLCIVFALLFLTAGCSRQDGFQEKKTSDFFYYNEEKIEYFRVRTDKVVIKTNSVSDAKSLSKESVFTTAYDVDFWVIATIDPKKTKINDLMKNKSVVDATYGLEYLNGTIQFPTNVISVNIKKENTIDEILSFVDLTDSVESIEYFDPLNNNYHITFKENLSDILTISRKLFETNMCEIISPVFFIEIKRM